MVNGTLIAIIATKNTTPVVTYVKLYHRHNIQLLSLTLNEKHACRFNCSAGICKISALKIKILKGLLVSFQKKIIKSDFGIQFFKIMTRFYL